MAIQTLPCTDSLQGLVMKIALSITMAPFRQVVGFLEKTLEKNKKQQHAWCFQTEVHVLYPQILTRDLKIAQRWRKDQ